MPNPLFRSGKCKAAMPDRVYIVGTGPNGLPYYNHLGANVFKIALNGAIGIPGVEYNMWTSFDPRCMDEPYFAQGMRQRRVIKIFGWQYLGLCSFDFWFRTSPALLSCMRPDAKPIPGTLRGGGSIFAAALQLCYFARVSEVNCIGVDFSGGGYWDGSQIKTKIEKKGTGNWKYYSQAAECLREIRASGITVNFISPSALAVKRNDDLIQQRYSAILNPDAKRLFKERRTEHSENAKVKNYAI